MQTKMRLKASSFVYHRSKPRKQISCESFLLCSSCRAKAMVKSRMRIRSRLRLTLISEMIAPFSAFSRCRSRPRAWRCNSSLPRRDVPQRSRGQYADYRSRCCAMLKGKTKDQSEDEALESDVRVWGIYSRRRKLEGNLGNNKAAAGREP